MRLDDKIDPGPNSGVSDCETDMMRADHNRPAVRSWRTLRNKVEARHRLLSRKRLFRTLGGVLSLGIFLLAFYMLATVFANLNVTALRQAIAATSAEQIFGACILTALSYFSLTGYDALALRQIRAAVPYRITALGSFTSYAISFTLGFPLITGGTVRYWIYARAGLTAGKVASLTVIAGVTFWIGMAFVVGMCLILRADQIANLNHLSPAMNGMIGAGVMLAIAIYIGWVWASPRKVRLQGLRLQLPGPLVTLGQMALGVTDLCAAAGVLYILLPAQVHSDFLTFAATYVFACILGIASHAPGGIGVFEVTMLKFTPGASEEALLASLLLFRIIYYVAPFVLALALLGASESMRHWASLRKAMTSERANEE